MDILIILVVAIVVFCLLWYLTGLVGQLWPKDAPPVPVVVLLRIVLILISVVWLWQRFMGGSL